MLRLKYAPLFATTLQRLPPPGGNATQITSSPAAANSPIFWWHSSEIFRLKYTIAIAITSPFLWIELHPIARRSDTRPPAVCASVDSTPSAHSAPGQTSGIWAIQADEGVLSCRRTDGATLRVGE